MNQVGHTGVLSTYIILSFSLVSHSLIITPDVIGCALIITMSLKSRIIVSDFKKRMWKWAQIAYHYVVFLSNYSFSKCQFETKQVIILIKMANTSGWQYRHGNWCWTPLKDVLLKSLRTLLSSPSLSIVGQQADVNLSLITLVCHSPPGFFPFKYSSQTESCQHKRHKLLWCLRISTGANSRSVLSILTDTPQQGDAIRPVVQDRKAREHFEEALGPPTVSGCRYTNFIMWRRRAAAWGL